MTLRDNLACDKNQLEEAVMHNLSGAPASPVLGQYYYNTSTNMGYLYTSSGWTPMTGTSVGDINIDGGRADTVYNSAFNINGGGA